MVFSFIKSTPSSEILGQARLLYEKCMSQARQPVFFLDYKIPDTPIGRYEILALHTALLLFRLKQFPELKSLSRELCNCFQFDVHASLRSLPVGDLSVGKYVKRFMQGFYGRLIAYDSALASEDEQLMFAKLAKNIFGIIPNPSEKAIHALASYALNTKKKLDFMELDHILNSEIFSEIPQI